MLNILRDEMLNAVSVAPASLSYTELAFPTLIITDTTLQGTSVVDTIADLIDIHEDLAVIFVLPKHPQAPPWGAQFMGKKVSFFTFGYSDQEFVSFGHSFADSLA